MRIRWAGLLACALMVAGCAYTGRQEIDNPIDRRLYWFSYVAGDDLRRGCDAGSPDSYRLIYTANYNREVRTYEVNSRSKVLVERVLRPSNLANLTLEDIEAIWEPVTARVRLSAADYAALEASLQSSGVFLPPPVGLDLPSGSYNWTATYCHNGRYGFTGWLYPSPAFSRLTFPTWLFQHDATGVSIPLPMTDPFAAVDAGLDRSSQVLNFQITVGQDGPVRGF